MLEGGAKTWTDRIFTLSPGENEWKEAGTLPVPYAYGASAGIREGLLCIGGCGKEGHRKDVYLLNLAKGTVTTHPFPSLPIALAYTAAAVLDGKVYLTGGCERPGEQDCTNRVFMLDTRRTEQGWLEQAPLPGRGRFLHQMAATDGALYVLGGIGLREQDGQQVRELLKEAWSYTPEHGWTRLPDMPYAIAAAPPRPRFPETASFTCLGGMTAPEKNTLPKLIPASITNPCAWTRQT